MDIKIFGPDINFLFTAFLHVPGSVGLQVMSASQTQIVFQNSGNGAVTTLSGEGFQSNGQTFTAGTITSIVFEQGSQTVGSYENMSWSAPAFVSALASMSTDGGASLLALWNSQPLNIDASKSVASVTVGYGGVNTVPMVITGSGLDDIIWGGKNSDLVKFSSSTSDILVYRAIDGLIVVSPEGNDFVGDNIESFEFTDTILTWEQLSALALKNSEDIFSTEGKLRFFAQLTQAAYHQAPNEPAHRAGEATNARNKKDASMLTPAEVSYDSLADNLTFLTKTDLPDLAPWSAGGWNNGLRSGASKGLFTNENAAALIARSEDALFISFRGTNDRFDSSFDHAHWLDREAHFDLLKPLLDAAVSYIENQGSGAGEVKKLYLTGHSLGGAMVMPAYEYIFRHFYDTAYTASDGSEFLIEGVTFASPGYTSLGGLDLPTHVNITNFWNSTDAIRLALGVSDIEGAEFSFNNAATELVDGFFNGTDAHSMNLYRAIAEFFQTENAQTQSVDLDLSGLLGGPAGTPIDRIAFSIEHKGDFRFAIGERYDVVLAGAWEATLGLMKDSVEFAAGKANPIIAALSTARNMHDLLVDPFLENGFDLDRGVRDLFSMETALDAWRVLKGVNTMTFLLGELAETVWTLSEKDLVLGGNGNDRLMGLGGKDVILGGAGEDALFGGWGKDHLVGGSDNDYLDGGRGIDTLVGGDGDDIYFVFVNGTNAVDDVLDIIIEHAGEGTDLVMTSDHFTLPNHVERLTISADDGSHHVNGTGNSLSNVMMGDHSWNTLEGRGGKDFLFGGGNNDVLKGGRGADILFGDWGVDRLHGGKGDDTLDGGKGKDFLEGGDGDDLFVFRSVKQIFNDRISDYKNGDDVIDLTRVDFANGGEFIGANSFSGSGTGQVSVVQKDRIWPLKDTTEIRIDVDGDGKQDAKIILEGLFSISEGVDLIL
ncbi:hypothetical protein NNA36_15195 [Shimia sp. CNT1-13L.2]|uniref:hypothetical protein n=1 Tax=Shimia sp. CNT1-13L.2 TaxID=2959663 RepID=UPI0020CC09D1|nr:hypothetical protein [Shimia sp. CNT1-13L.2]MCP9483310.1 hypothetical protein [Shimia sp. CNT1-13L.2]